VKLCANLCQSVVKTQPCPLIKPTNLRVEAGGLSIPHQPEAGECGDISY